MYIGLSHKRGVGSLIGAVFVLLIFVSGYSLFLFNTKAQTNYQNILGEMNQKDLEQSQERLEFDRVTTDEDNKLKITVINAGPRTSEILYIGTINKQTIPEIQNYYDVELYIEPSEKITYTCPDIYLYEGEEYEIQLLSEYGNVFSTLFKPGYEVFSDVAISIKSGGVWEYGLLPNSYNIENGNYVNGTWPESITDVDNSYLRIESVYSPGGIFSYNPSFFNLVNATTYISGVVGDLSGDDGIDMSFQGYTDFLPRNCYPSTTNPLGWTSQISGNASNLVSDDGEYASFFSYPTRTSTTTSTNALVSYRSRDFSGEDFPKMSIYNETWYTPFELQYAGSNIRYVRVASCTLEERSYEKIVVTLIDSGILSVYVYNGTDWKQSIFGDMDGRNERPFDVAYEGTSGRALLVYGNKIDGSTRDLSYRIWDGRTWSQEFYLDDTTQSEISRQYRWVNLVPNPTPGSNEIAFSGIDSDNNDANVALWNGTHWIDFTEICHNIPSSDYESISIAYEYTTGNLLAVAANGNQVRYRIYAGTWSAPLQFDINPYSSSVMRYLTLKSHRYSGSNRIMLLSLDDARDLCSRDWDGSTWGTVYSLDGDMETDTSRCIDGDWEPGDTKFVVFGGNRNTDPLSYKSWTPAGGWSLGRHIWSTYSGLTQDQRWVQVKADPRNVGNAKLLIGTLDDSNDLVLSTWDGSTISNQVELSNDIGLNNREIFDIQFNLFGDPEEFTCEVEFEGNSGLSTWSDIKWTVDSSVTAAETSVVYQLYNFYLDSYVTSGDGYIEYNSSPTPGTDELFNQTIMSNPEHYRNSTGSWKLKVLAIKNASSPFTLSLDLHEYEPKEQHQISIVEFIGSSNADPWLSLNWEIDSSWNQGDVNTTLQLFNYFTGDYSTSGDGYIEYTSSSTPDIDELKKQIIGTSPWQYRDPYGDWKIRIKGIKKTNNNLELSIDKTSYDTTGGSFVAATEFTFMNVPMDSLQGLKCAIVSDHNESMIGVQAQIWNYVTDEYEVFGQGYESYTAMSGNESVIIYISSGVNAHINNGEVKLRITSQFSNVFEQNINEVKLDYSHVIPMLPFDTWQTYTINVLDAATEEPRPYIGLTLFADGSAVIFNGEPNPEYVFADSSGRYVVDLKSSVWSGETFKLNVFVGSVAAEKTIIQAPWGGG